MKIYKTQSKVIKDIKNGVLVIHGDVIFECSISIHASIHITFGNITAINITARDIIARDITARNITARDIIAGNIIASDITARDIIANDISADDISYHALCMAYESITCTSIEAKKEVCQEPICLDGELTIKSKIDDKTQEAMRLLRKEGYKIVKE